MGELFGKAYLRSVTPDKAIHGFKCSGLWPFNPNVFTDVDFSASDVTHEPCQAMLTTQVPSTSSDQSTSLNIETEHEQEVGVERTLELLNVNSDHQYLSNLTESDDSMTTSRAEDTFDNNRDKQTRGIVGSEASQSSGVCSPLMQSIMPQASEPQASAHSGEKGHSSHSIEAQKFHENSIKDTVKEVMSSLSPLPKISSRRPRKRKAESAAILTSSPYKQSLEMKSCQEKRRRKASGKKTDKSVSKNKMTSKRCVRKRQEEASDEDDPQWPCLICGETFSASREKWIQCQTCLNWAHLACTEGGEYFVCQNCDSDDDIE